MQNQKIIRPFIIVDEIVAYDYAKIEAWTIAKLGEEKVQEKIGIKFETKDLNNYFVLVKRCSGKFYFYKGKHRNADTRASRAQLFTGKDAAEKGLAEANQDRTKYKYKISPASQYLKSSWRVHYDYHGNVIIENDLQNLRDKSFVVHTKESCDLNKESVKKSLSEQLTREKRDLESAKRSVLEHETAIKERERVLKELEEFDLKGFIDQNTTESEKTAAVLYGK